MRKFALLVLTLALVCVAIPFCVAAAAQTDSPAPLTMAELRAWCDDVWQQARQEALLNNPQETLDAQSGLYLIQTEPVTLESATPTLDEADNPVGRVTLNTGELLGPRGIGLGSSLEQLLSAYPNNNPALTGDQEFAALYVYGPQEGPVPGEIAWAWVVRDGYRVQSVQYAVSAPQDAADTYTDAGVQYIITDGYVSDMQVYGLLSAITAEEAQANVDTLRDIAARASYTPGEADAQRMRATPLAAEDLIFSGFDFTNATPQSVQARFGAPDFQENMADEDDGPGQLIYGYEGMEFAFALDAQSNPGALDSMLIDGPRLEGPRGLYVGEDLADVLATFRKEEESAGPGEGQVILYAQGATLDDPPFGLLDYYGAMDATVRYAVSLAQEPSGEAAMLHLTVENNALTEIYIYRWVHEVVPQG
ncbi:MAG: hypothetical protein LBU67_09005 [Oscillospiraceae bacterium]|nr:hypothetical protein [Oscillospiraceae bacterium]